MRGQLWLEVRTPPEGGLWKTRLRSDLDRWASRCADAPRGVVVAGWVA